MTAARLMTLNEVLAQVEKADSLLTKFEKKYKEMTKPHSDEFKAEHYDTAIEMAKTFLENENKAAPYVAEFSVIEQLFTDMDDKQKNKKISYGHTLNAIKTLFDTASAHLDTIHDTALSSDKEKKKAALIRKIRNAVGGGYRVSFVVMKRFVGRCSIRLMTRMFGVLSKNQQ